MSNEKHIDYKALANHPRLLLEAELAPLQGNRFQPTGFADLGPARYKLPDNTDMLLVESPQSVANRMELACWDPAAEDLIAGLRGLPYIKITDANNNHLTNSILEAHRINSEYIMKDTRRLLSSSEKRQLAEKPFSEEFAAEIGYQKDGRVDWKKFYAGLFKYDPNSLIHGCFLEEIGGRLRATRVLSGFIEASDVQVAESGGVKNNIVQPELKEGAGNVLFHRTEFVARQIKAYFNLDLALLRGYGLGHTAPTRDGVPSEWSDPEKLLIALSLLKIRLFLSTGLRLRTACDLEVKGELNVTRPSGLHIPEADVLLEECKGLIKAIRDADKRQEDHSKRLFADPAITLLEWTPNSTQRGKKRGKDSGPGGTDESDTAEQEDNEA
ncbi:MAG TPA: type I-U CRISPR-associated RAMP protein Csb1/Cas7u [Phycisphaerae bacterium]|nr:type I-U CRISPR-associated RAMP protein Csb1/Cas7u [Phycisphaerae bacterium]HON68616.1 type I-U CRISPR-associated RAMP protein Csb1/Cas7u [Phycisphaerae bacterium]